MPSGAFELQQEQRTAFNARTSDNRRRDHRFYTSMAFAMAAGVFGGFAPTYYARGYFHGPPIPLWVQLHGAVFTAWMLLYLLQNLLAMYGGMKLHRNLGLLGAVLSAAIVFFGAAIAVRQVKEGRFFPFPDAYSDLAVSFAQMLLLAVFLTLGLLLRRQPEKHKRLMLMAPMLFFFPSFGRLLHGINPLTLVLALCLYLAGPVYDRLTRGQVHSVYRWGVPLLTITMPPFTVLASRAQVWHSFVDRLMH